MDQNGDQNDDSSKRRPIKMKRDRSGDKWKRRSKWKSIKMKIRMKVGQNEDRSRLAPNEDQIEDGSKWRYIKTEVDRNEGRLKWKWIKTDIDQNEDQNEDQSKRK